MISLMPFAIELSLQAADAQQESWVHLTPLGSFHGRDGRGPYQIPDGNEVIEHSRNYAGQCLIPVDYDHQIDNAPKNGQPAIAAGWIKGLQLRADGIWGLTEWTPKAAAHIAAKEFRYISPVMQLTSDLTVYSIPRASLTNNPNLDQLTAVAAMEAQNMDTFLIELRKLLGLPDGADEQAVLGKLRELLTVKQSSMPDPSKYVPIGEFERVVVENNRLNQGVTLQAAKDHVESQISNFRLPPYLREWGVSLCTANKPAFDAFVDRTKKMFTSLNQEVATMSRINGGEGKTILTDDEKDAARRMGLTDAEFLKGKSA